jgi:hypothetical protein
MVIFLDAIGASQVSGEWKIERFPEEIAAPDLG